MQGIRIIKSMEGKYLEEALAFVDRVFTESDGAAEGKLVSSLVEEIRRKRFYAPELELIMVDEKEEIIEYKEIKIN